MPLPEGHYRDTHTPRALGERERWLIRLAVVLAAALVLGLVISLASSGGTPARGCIDLTYQAATGGTELKRCGGEARALCAQAGAPSPPSPLKSALLDACPRAGLRTRP